MEFVVLDLARGDLTAANLAALEAEGYRQVGRSGDLLLYRKPLALVSRPAEPPAPTPSAQG